jgi:hypothetical protein
VRRSERAGHDLTVDADRDEIVPFEDLHLKRPWQLN